MAKDLNARISYLKGLTEGLSLDETSKEGKLLLRIVDLLDQISREIEQLKTDSEELFEYTKALDEDLAELEDDFYVDEDDDDEDDDGVDFSDDFDYDDDDDYERFTVECPNCGEMVEVSDDLLHREGPVKVTCPRCNEVVLIDDEEWEEGELDELLDGEDDTGEVDE